MNPFSDKHIREQIGSLDHISPPTNWNAESTWRRIAPSKAWYKHLSPKSAYVVIAFLLLLTFFWPNTIQEDSPIYITAIEVSVPSSKAHSLTQENTDVLSDQMLIDIMDDSAGQETTSSVSNFVQLNTEPALPPLQDSDSETEQKTVVIDLADSSYSEQFVEQPVKDSIPLPQNTVEKPSKSSPVISISLHADHVKKAPQKVQRSIIKLRNDYRYTTSKKVYSLQINK